MTESTRASTPRFCSQCGVQLLPNARFCHSCGASVDGLSPAAQSPHVSPILKWGVPAGALIALAAVSFWRIGATPPPSGPGTSAPMTSAGAQPPDISSMSPEERADRLFNRVMSLASEGKSDSARFFAPMAISAFEGLGPLGAHGRYDLGLIALVAGDAAKAAAQSDTILKERPTHLLGLSLAARAADARGAGATAKSFREKLIAAEKSERAAGLQEYKDHDADIRASLDEARKR